MRSLEGRQRDARRVSGEGPERFDRDDDRPANSFVDPLHGHRAARRGERCTRHIEFVQVDPALPDDQLASRQRFQPRAPRWGFWVSHALPQRGGGPPSHRRERSRPCLALPWTQPIALAGATEIEPPSRISGTRAHECPNGCMSAHIRTYSQPRPSGPATKPLQMSLFVGRGGRRDPNCHAEGRGFESLQPLRFDPLRFGRLTLGRVNQTTRAYRLGDLAPIRASSGSLSPAAVCLHLPRCPPEYWERAGKPRAQDPGGRFPAISQVVTAGSELDEEEGRVIPALRSLLISKRFQ
jgi:hypothetical protein